LLVVHVHIEPELFYACADSVRVTIRLSEESLLTSVKVPVILRTSDDAKVALPADEFGLDGEPRDVDVGVVARDRGLVHRCRHLGVRS
jgi:hypothetical protein